MMLALAFAKDASVIRTVLLAFFALLAPAAPPVFAQVTVQEYPLPARQFAHDVWAKASLAGSYVGRIDPRTHTVTVLQPPTRGQGARRVWSDSKGAVWTPESTVDKVVVYRYN